MSPHDDLTRRLRRVDLLLLRAVRRQRERPSMVEKGQFWGSMITDADVNDLLEAHAGDPPPVDEELEAAIRSTVAARDEPTGRFGRLCRTFELGPEAVDILLFAIAPEIGAGYGRIFAYLHDDLSNPNLTPDVVMQALHHDRSPRLALLESLLPEHPLRSHHLLTLGDEPGPLARQPVYLGSGVLPWLLGHDEVSWGAGLGTSASPLVPEVTRARLDELDAALRSDVTGCLIGGTPGARDGTAIEIARRQERTLVRVDVTQLFATEPAPSPAAVARDLRLRAAVPYLVNAPLTDDEPLLRSRAEGLRRALRDHRGPLLVGASDRRTASLLAPEDRPQATVPVSRATNRERAAAWSDAWARRGWSRPERAREVAERFHAVAGTTIEAVLDRASAESGHREPELAALWAAAREAARPELKGLAQRIVPRYEWSDLVLPEHILGQLQHLGDYLEHQETVLDHWGGRRVRPRGYGLKVLFSGAPGTGKTMCAEVLAGSLGLDLYKVDLSSVISRWVGETEKNLREIFDAAEGGTAVLLFDEADALFGARGDVKQAQDRFANQEVSYLLQRLEVFEGCAVLTTNLQENIDEAFLRRFGAVIEFPLPSAAERAHLWARAVPERAPRAPDLDLDALARQFVLSGGSIVNAAIHGCVVAAAEQQPVGMRHLVRAVARELVKMGRQVNEVHFGAYFTEVQDLR